MHLIYFTFLFTTICLMLSDSTSSVEIEKKEVYSVKEEQFGDKLDIKDRKISELLERVAELEKKDKVLELQIANINKPEAKLEEFNEFNVERKAESCLPFANSPGIHTVQVPNIEPFNVLCANTTTESGWIVIQQRINGKENFARGWASYRAGFGSFDEDFFLGLEKIHRLTTNQRYELSIRLQKFNGAITYANYNYFAIAGEDDQYKLFFLDGFSGNEPYNGMKSQKGAKFYTFDRDNLSQSAKSQYAGWWYNEVWSQSNLNGIYYNKTMKSVECNYWLPYQSLKKVQMLIRPRLYNLS